MIPLVAKNVLGELTLRDIITHFKDKIESFHIYSEHGVDCYPKNWGINKKKLCFYGEHEAAAIKNHKAKRGVYSDLYFDLDSKVKAYGDKLELKEQGSTFVITVYQKINFNCLVPKRKK